MSHLCRPSHRRSGWYGTSPLRKLMELPTISFDAKLHVEMAQADGGYSSVVCDTLGLAPMAHAVCNQAAGEPLQTSGGFYLATAMLARLRAPTLGARV